MLSGPRGVATGPTITVDPATPGITIPNDFVGFSYEHSYITLDKLTAVNTALKNFHNLFSSKLSLRIGGNTSDTQIGPNAGIDRMATYVSTVGATLVYGLPGKLIAPSATDAAQATVDAAIAARIAAILGTANVFYQIGNEPNFYGIAYATYLARWDTIKAAVVGSVAAAKFAGSDDGATSISRPTFSLQMATDRGSALTYFTAHRYGSVVGQNDGTISLPLLLAEQGGVFDARDLPRSPASNAKPWRMTEAGSVTGATNLEANMLGGTPWVLRLMSALAKNGWAGVNWHGSESLTQGYSPLLDNNDGTWNAGANAVFPGAGTGAVYDGNGTYTAQAQFYAMKLFHALVGGQVLPIKSSLGEHYALGVKGADTLTRILVINPNLTTGLNVSLASSAAFTTATAMLLTGSNYLSRNITINGVAASGLGVFAPAAESIPVAGGLAALRLPPASSAVVTLT